jgi:hypothetical protein
VEEVIWTLILKTDGTSRMSNHESMPSLEFFRAAVGGYIEVVPYLSTLVRGGAVERCIAYCNEEGKLQGSPINMAAMVLWGDAQARAGVEVRDVLCGDVVIFWGDPEDMAEA